MVWGRIHQDFGMLGPSFVENHSVDWRSGNNPVPKWKLKSRFNGGGRTRRCFVLHRRCGGRSGSESSRGSMGGVHLQPGFSSASLLAVSQECRTVGKIVMPSPARTVSVGTGRCTK